MQYKENSINLDDIAGYDVVYIELRETAVLFPWGKPKDKYYFLDDIFMDLTKSSLIYHNIRPEIDEAMPTAKLETKKELLKKRFFLAEETVNILYDQEIQIDLKHIKRRKFVWELYQHLNDKIIYFVIDEDETIIHAKKILQKCGFDSYSGIIYEKNVTDNLESIENKRVLIVGRKKYIDLPQYGFIFIPETEYVFSGGYNNAIIVQNAVKRAAGSMQYIPWINNVPGYSIMHKMIANKFFDNPFVEWRNKTEFNADPYFVGYYALGMHIAGVVKWIIQKSMKEQYNRILFCARDGFLIKKAYDICYQYNKNLPKSEYIQGSRKLLLPVLLKNERDFYDIPGAIYYLYSPYKIILLLWVFTKYSAANDFHHATYEEQEEEIKESVQRAGFGYYNNFASKEEMSRFMTLFLAKFYNIKNHEILKGNIEEYYREYQKGDVLFDAGYSGKLPNAICKSSSGIEDVLYLYSDDDSCELLQREGKFHVDTFYNFRPAVDNAIREYIISENGPSCIGLVRKLNALDEMPIPVFECDEEDYCKSDVIQQMQDAAIDFVKDLYSEFGSEWQKVPFTGRETSLPFEGFIRCINEYDLEMFSNTYQEDYHTGKKSEQNWSEFYKRIMRPFNEQ